MFLHYLINGTILGGNVEHEVGVLILSATFV
jgi:hypothetical protein